MEEVGTKFIPVEKEIYHVVVLKLHDHDWQVQTFPVSRNFPPSGNKFYKKWILVRFLKLFDFFTQGW